MIKPWAMVDLKSRYVLDVAIYNSKGTSIGDDNIEHGVLMNLYAGVEY